MTAVIVRPDLNASVLQKEELNAPSFSEEHLQELVRCNPELLLVEEIEPAYAPLTCIGREVDTGGGRLDNLYISSSGGITIVETKLWKNPEARRAVVTQIIGYAQKMSQWDYTQIEAVWTAYQKKYGLPARSLFEHVQAEFCDKSDVAAEPRFTDRVTHNLRCGRHLLLIVGDGIHQGLDRLADFLQGMPDMRFHLALVKIGSYPLPNEDGAMLYVPRVVGRTAEVERAVVRVEIGETALAAGVIATAKAVKNVGSTHGRKVSLSEGEFFDALEENVPSSVAASVRSFLDEVLTEVSGTYIDMKQRLFLRWNPPSLDLDDGIKLLGFDMSGTVWPPIQGKQKEKQLVAGAMAAHRAKYWERLGDAHTQLPPQPGSKGKYGNQKYVPLVEVVPRLQKLKDAVLAFAADVEEDPDLQ